MNSKKLLAGITDKWPAKVLSIAGALILLLFHRMSMLETRFFSTPLVVRLGSELVPASSHVNVVRISLRGEPNSINPIVEGDIEAYIDLEKYTTEGRYQVPVQINRKGSAIGVEPLEISVDPMEISVELEEMISRNIPLSPVFVGTVASGFELVHQSLFPAGVVAEGPRNAVEAITTLETEVIDLEGRNNDFSIMVNVINNDPFVIIRGNRMAEFRGSIRRLMRESERVPVAEIEGPAPE